jgi:Tc toxin complex TcA C-terminal TcB-binding domain
MNITATQVGFHNRYDAYQQARPRFTWRQDTEFTYTFENFFHPYVGELIEQLNKKSLAGLLDPNYHQSLARDFFAAAYTALAGDVVKLNTFPKEIDVRDGGPYANYNWELLFHIPVTVAVHLSKNQRFAEAQRWFHYVFDPTCNDTSVPTPQRFWKFLRFRQQTDVQQLDDLLALLSKPDGECTAAELDLKAKVLSGYEAVRNRPFQPHAVARTRTLAYQYSVVMKYLDNLIAWGDSLFRQDTVESLNEATQRYVLAANLLGPRPQQVPPRGTVRPKTFDQLKAAGLDAMGNALVELEGQFPFNLALPPSQTGDGQGDQSGPLFGIGRTLYFCLPRNDKLLGYWDTVADRLFKIRHCMNIEGVVRQLALFDPPLDPGMLVKAAAAGIDLGAVVSGLNQPAGPVRSPVLIQKALEVCAEVRGLGGALLAALEKGDAEHLALLRQGHEIKLQQLSQEVRFLQWKQAQEATEGLLRTRASALERYRFYQRLLGLTPDGGAAPDTLPLDRRELTEENFDEAYGALVAQYDRAVAVQAYPQLKLAGGGSPANQSGASGTGKLNLIANEDAELNTHLPTARDTRLASSVADTIASVLVFIPDFNAHLHFWGLGASAKVFGGSTVSEASKIAAEILRTVSGWEQDQAGMASRTASYERRADDWTLQSNLAARELVQLGRQLLTSLLAEQAARREYLNVQAQVAQSQEVDRFLRDKFTGEELYAWMQGELARLYYEYYRFAFDVARKAERTLKQELMRPELDGTDFVRFNYWDGGRKGLLSGEALYLDVKRMELAYHENNKREFELTRHVSLRQLDPLALLSLRVTGRCEVSIPEWLYDRECPGHYLRRLKSVAVSLPSVVGPYTSVNCTLSLLRSSVRKVPLLKDGAYARTGADDDRFVDSFGAVQSVVTSGGSNDSGLFETNLRDERFLPFEGAGAVGTWRLELPGDFRPFDYGTISDAILHVRYTARQGGGPLGAQALAEMREMFATANRSGLALLFSLAHDFPTEWSAFANGNADFAVRLRKDYFPYLVQNEALVIDALELYAARGGGLVRRAAAVPANLADDLNGANGYSDVSLAPDANVLRRDAATVFLIVRYSFA